MRNRPSGRRPPAWKGVTLAVALHAVAIGSVSEIRFGVMAEESRGRETPVRVTWTEPRESFVFVPAVSPPMATRQPRPELIEFPELASADLPPISKAAAEPSCAPFELCPPSAEEWTNARTVAAARPGRGGTAGSAGLAVSGLAGDAIGAGSGGGVGGGSDADLGGALGGPGRGDASHGAGTGGATRGPSFRGTLAAPEYPQRARSRGWEGRVVLDLTIGADGRVTGIEIAESSGRAALDQAACDAARRWTFEPALRNGGAIAGAMRVPVRFALTD